VDPLKLKVDKLSTAKAIQSIGLRVVTLLVLFLVTGFSVYSQQPFVTDDADVTPRRHFHFEFSNQFDLLQRSSAPSLKQNTAVFELAYGLFDGVEIGIEAPVITIFNQAGTIPHRPAGIGDTNVSLKYNFLTENENSRRPALAVGLNLELPTGDVDRQLGSGLADFYINGIFQKSVTNRTKVRLNSGVLFSGNQSTGVVGIKSRGTVFTAGGSFVREFTSRLTIGAEISGAFTRSLSLGKGQLQGLIGGNYAIQQKVTLDFGLVAGKYAASPRAGIQVGFSVDW
jgi:hypothetical protein